MRGQHPQSAVRAVAQRRERRARTAGRGGGRRRSSRARPARRPAASAAPRARARPAPRRRAGPTTRRSVDVPGGPPPTTPSSTTSPRNACGTIARPQLLPDLAHQRRQVGLPRLDLAARELPAAVVGAARPLRDQHPVAVDDRRADHLDDVERRPRGRRRVRVEVALHRAEDPPPQHHLVDERRPAPRAARSPSPPARRPACPRRWPRTAGNGSATASRGPGPTA